MLAHTEKPNERISCIACAELACVAWAGNIATNNAKPHATHLNPFIKTSSKLVCGPFRSGNDSQTAQALLPVPLGIPRPSSPDGTSDTPHPPFLRIALCPVKYSCRHRSE